MATLNISYYGTVDKLCPGDALKSEQVTTSGTSAQSAAIPTNAIVATFNSDTAHVIQLGDDPTAAIGAGSFILGAGATWSVRITNRPGEAGGTFKIAAKTI